MLGLFDHPNIVKLLDFWVVSDKYTLIFEFAGKSLRALKNEWLFACAQLKDIFKQLLSALAHVHEAWVVHNDLSAANVLYNRESGRVCLIDFGNSVPCLAEFAPAAKRKTDSVKEDTLWYRPRELLLGYDDPHSSIDIWGAGVLFGQLVLGQPMFPGDSEIDMTMKILAFFGKPRGQFWTSLPLWKASFPKFPAKELPPIFQDRVGKEGVDFFNQMCRVDRGERASAKALTAHDFTRDDAPAPWLVFWELL